MRCLLTWLLLAAPAMAGDPWVANRGGDGPGRGKKIVLISGDEEYRSEETLTQLGRILAKHHGFDCTVLYAIDPKDGTINPNVSNNIPGLAALDTADLMVIFTRFRDLPDEQMNHIVNYVEAGKPVIGLRTATHAFKTKPAMHAQWSCENEDWPGRFGYQILGEAWVAHHGDHGKEGTRGIIVSEQAHHPILRGIRNGDVFGKSDVYRTRLPLSDCTPLLLGEVTTTLAADSPAVVGAKNNPMMPVAWTKTNGKRRVFTTTVGASQDFASAGVRRLLVNACYWAVGLEEKIAPDANVDIVGAFSPTPFCFNGFKKGVRPDELRLDAGAKKLGHLIAVGGGGTTPAIVKKTLELAGGPKARMLIVPQSSASLNSGKSSADFWRESGAENINVLSLDDKEQALKSIKEADLIWMPGGDQNRLMKAVEATGIPEAIRERYQAGATVGGTSAGAAVLSGVMLTGDADLTAIRQGNTKSAMGLDLWPGAIVDQHFIKRQRFNRLLSAVMDHPQLIGIGVDESTAAILTGSTFEVVGAGQVVVIDARNGKVAAPNVAGDIRIHVLTEGMTFDMTPAK